jgi:nucleotide-binding universal stress UspA family protein/quercetin dioxygenase-like cupin family protein
MPNIRTILHPTDFSEYSCHAFQTACTLARNTDATLYVLHVMMPSASPLLKALPPDPSRSVESQESLARLPWPQAPDPRLRVERRLAEGDPAEEILRFTDRLPCDLIVIGSHGRTGMRRLLTGSVAEEVMRKAACPVLVVKAPIEAAPAQMAGSPARPGDPIDVRALGSAVVSAVTRTLVRTSTVEVTRLIVRAGQEIHRHTTSGEVIILCIEGRVALAALGKNQELEAGKLVLLPAGEPHAFTGIEDASLLLTVLAPRQ